MYWALGKRPTSPEWSRCRCDCRTYRTEAGSMSRRSSWLTTKSSSVMTGSYGSPRPWFILMYWTSVLSDPHWKKYSLRSSAIARSSPVLHRLPHDAGQLVRPHLGGRDQQQPLLLHRPVDDVVDLVFLVAQLAHAAR